MLIDNRLSIGVYYNQNSKGAEGPTSAPLLFFFGFFRAAKTWPRSARGSGCGPPLSPWGGAHPLFYPVRTRKGADKRVGSGCSAGHSEGGNVYV